VKKAWILCKIPKGEVNYATRKGAIPLEFARTVKLRG
jgi:hypothetical protein